MFGVQQLLYFRCKFRRAAAEVTLKPAARRSTTAPFRVLYLRAAVFLRFAVCPRPSGHRLQDLPRHRGRFPQIIWRDGSIFCALPNFCSFWPQTCWRAEASVKISHLGDVTGASNTEPRRRSSVSCLVFGGPRFLEIPEIHVQTSYYVIKPGLRP